MFSKYADIPKANAQVLTPEEQELEQQKLAQRLASLNAQRVSIRESSYSK